MQLTSVNIGKARNIEGANKSGETGIYKQPVAGPVRISSPGLPRDAICDTENHGGVDQAVYVFGAPDYAWWAKELGRELTPGTFGENLTISELESAAFSIGDRLHIGEVILEVTAPRIPCGTLAARMGDSTFVKRFRNAERPGLYCRVIREGNVQSGDEVTYEAFSGETVTAIEMFRAFYEKHLDEVTLRRHLAAPVAIRDRVEKEKKLAELTDSFQTARLRAERLRSDHFNDLRWLHTNAEAMAPLWGVLTEQTSRDAMQVDLDLWTSARFGRWMFYTRDDHQFVGRCGVQRSTVEEKEEIELLYALLPEFWGAGLAVEMTVAVLEWMSRRHPGVTSIVATVKPENTRSRCVLEKSGFVFERQITYFDLPHLLFRSWPA